MKGKNVYIIVAVYDIVGFGTGHEIVGVFENIEDARKSLHDSVEEMKDKSCFYDEQCEVNTEDEWRYVTDDFLYTLTIHDEQVK